MGNDKLSFKLITKVCLFVAALICVSFQYWIGLVIIVPMYFIESILARFKAEKFATIFKILIVMQGLFIWYISSNGFLHSKPDKPMVKSKIDVKFSENEHKTVQRHGVPITKPYDTTFIVPIALTALSNQPINTESLSLIHRTLGKSLVATNFPDLRYHKPEEIRSAFPVLFSELPTSFLDDFKNPCWVHKKEKIKKSNIITPAKQHELIALSDMTDHLDEIVCLPYAYVLGQPKCGTSDLFERLKQHSEIVMPKRKEVRWFTRGEFTTSKMLHEGDARKETDRTADRMVHAKGEQLLGPASTVYSLVGAFSELGRELEQRHRNGQDEDAFPLITIDGGPHTFWWPTQNADGSHLPHDIPPLQIIHTMQPNAKFIVTLSNPTDRMYSDYHFLNDDLKPVRPEKLEKSLKTPQEFHSRVEAQISMFHSCVNNYVVSMKRDNKVILEILFGAPPQKRKEGENEEVPIISDKTHPDFAMWFRASQICAHDRHHFAVGGHGRLAIGLYVLFYEKWLEFFPPSQFLVTKLENYNPDPTQYMTRIFDFLDLSQSSEEEWTQIVKGVHANEHKNKRSEMLSKTREMLDAFYHPYNALLAEFLNNRDFEFTSPLVDKKKHTEEPNTATTEEHPQASLTPSKHKGAHSNAELARIHDLHKHNALSHKVQPHQAQTDPVPEPEKPVIGSDHRIPHRTYGRPKSADEVDTPQDKRKHFLDKRAGRVSRPANREPHPENGDDAPHEPKHEHERDHVRDLLPNFPPKPLHGLPGLNELIERENHRGEERDHHLVGGEDRDNQHGVHRHIHHEVEEEEEEEETESNKLSEAAINHLRGSRKRPEEVESGVLSYTFTPQSFDISSLPQPKNEGDEKAPWTFSLNKERILRMDNEASLLKTLSDRETAGIQLCLSAYGLDLKAVKYLLWDVGVSPDVLHTRDGKRNAFHALSLLYTMADAHSKSHIFALLKGQPSWLTPLLTPNEIPLKQQSPLAQDVLTALAPSMIEIAQWLTAAGVDPALQDISGNTPLHHACMGGLFELAEYLVITSKVDVNTQNFESRTPLHYAAAYGHVQLAKLLIENGADVSLKDKFKVSPEDIISNPGAIFAEDAEKELGITQRKAKQISRIIHPESSPDAEAGWTAGTGGWGPERLPGYEEEMDCSGIDQYWASEIEGDEIFHNYMARNAPVMIRGLLGDWKIKEKFDQQALVDEFGHLDVQVSDIPYAQKFGGAEKVDMKLSEYIAEVKEHRMVGGQHPWYVFKGHPIPSGSEGDESLVKYEHFPTPPTINDVFEWNALPNMKHLEGKKSREMFVNAQWALGGEGTGAPIHFHNSAWSALVYGAKKWIIYPPHNMIMSNKQILDFIETDMMTLAERGVKPITCVQTAGDVLIIPESWAHGVLNIQESIAIATEVKQSLWRIKPLTAIFSKFPNFDNRAASREAREKGTPPKIELPPKRRARSSVVGGRRRVEE